MSKKSSRLTQLWDISNPGCVNMHLDHNSLCTHPLIGLSHISTISPLFAEAVAAGLYVLWGFVVVTTSVTKAAKRKRSRECLSPPPPQTPPLSHSPPNWAGYLPGGIGGPVVSPVRPYYPPHYPGQHPSYHSPSIPTNHNPGLSLFRNTNTGGGGAPVQGQSNPSPPFYQPEFSPNNQEHVSVYRSPFHAPSHGYNQPARVIRRPTNPGAVRPGGGGSRRSVSSNREGLPARRSSNIRPGQFGYGRVPFSLPLHRPNRQARHTGNGTDTATPEPGLAANEDDETNEKEEEEVWSNGEGREARRSEVEVEEEGAEEERTDAPAVEELPTTTTTTATCTETGIFTKVLVLKSHQPATSTHYSTPTSRIWPSNQAGMEEEELLRSIDALGRRRSTASASRRCVEAVRWSPEQSSVQPLTPRSSWVASTTGNLSLRLVQDKQCELTCRPAGYRFYVRQAERVRDGTPCINVSSNDVCVEGQCLVSAFKCASMRSGTGASVVNGRWAVDPPGEYQAGGTTFTYTRPRAQAEGEEEKGESLKAPGPTTTQLQLYIIFHKENPGIDYEFYVPVEKKEIERERLMERERETPRERHREREPARAPLR
ncbi:Thrombospondin type-1 domain-containing protein 4, partial [Larimichthys crocea]